MMIKIGDLEITSHVQDATIKPLGGTTKRSSTSFPGTRRYSMYHEGIEPRGWSLSLLGVDDQAGLDAILAAFNDAPEDTRFYPYFATRFARVAQAAAWEALSYHYHNDVWAAEAEVYATIADLFDEEATTWYPAKNEYKSITPAGTIAAPLDELKIIGTYVDGHVASPTLEVWNAAKTTLEGSVLITDLLLTDEELTLDYRGKITQVYTEDFSSAVKFSQDAINTGGELGGGELVLGTDCGVAWKLSGPWPLSKNIIVTGTITGSGYLLYSYDCTTWKMAVSKSDLGASTSWTIPNSAGHGDIYIGFSPTSGGTDAEERTEDTILAEIVAPTRDRDDYYKGIWGKTYQAGEYMYIVKLSSTLYAYQLQAAGAAVLTNTWKIGTDYEASLDLYNNSTAVTTTDRTEEEILTDITTPSTARDRDDYYIGIWGRVDGAGSYAYVVKLDDSTYAYQLQTSGAAVLTNPWYKGTAQEVAEALYDVSVISTDRTADVIQAEITAKANTLDRGTYYKGFWGRTYGSGTYMYVIKLTSTYYAYQLQYGEAAVLTNPWYIGTASAAAQALYDGSLVVAGRTRTTIYNDIRSGSDSRDRDNYYNGVWARTYGSGYYAYLVRLESNLYAYQIQAAGTPVLTKTWHIGTRLQAATAMYAASQTGTRTITDISNDIANTTFGDYTSWSVKFGVYGPNASKTPAANVFKLNNSPAVFAYQVVTTEDGSTVYGDWTICDDYTSVSADDAGYEIADALLAADDDNNTYGTRSKSTIQAEITSASFAEPSTYQWTADGGIKDSKPTATIIKLNNTPHVFAYQITLTTGAKTAWAIDDQAGAELVAELIADTPGGDRTVSDIKASITSASFDEPSTYYWQVYGYVNGAKPIATIIQVNNSPQVLFYNITYADASTSGWLLEANSGADCRDALTNAFTGIASRTQDDIRADIINASFQSPSTYDWQIYGLVDGELPMVTLIQVNNSPRVFAYQIETLGSTYDWAIDTSLGVSIAATLAGLSSISSSSGSAMTLANIVITQERRIPWQKLPLLPIDGLAHCVRIKNAPDVLAAFVKATGTTIGDSETFTVTATGIKYYIQADTGKYLSSSWGNNYVSCVVETPGATEKFDIVKLGESGGNDIVAIKCSSGQYLSASADGGGFVLAETVEIGPNEMFEFIPQGDDQYAFRVFTPTAEVEALELDEGALDSSALDGAISDIPDYAGNYLSAISGTLDGVNPVTAAYRDRYHI